MRKRTRNGARKRSYIRGYIYKDRKTPERANWIVLEEVRQAVKILEVATRPWRAKSSLKFLFCSAVGRILNSGGVRKRFNALRDRINELFDNPIPNWEAKPWRIQPRQLRRTCARFIAREPWGIIAGASQFKHLSVRTFEGYANLNLLPSSLREFHDEIEEEKILAQPDWIDELVDAAATGQIAGPGGQELMNAFKGLVADRDDVQEARRLLRQQLGDVTLHPRQTNLCRFRSAKALCLEKANKPEDGPIMTFCEPGRCANSCITKSHLPAWKKVIEDADWFAKQAPARSPKRELILREKAEAEALIAELVD